MDSAAAREETEIPSLERLFDVGSLLPVYVTSVDGGRSRIGLSVNPRLVNSHITAKDVKPGLVRNWICIEHHLDPKCTCSRLEGSAHAVGCRWENLLGHCVS